MEIEYELEPEDFFKYGKQVARKRDDFSIQKNMMIALVFLFIFSDIIYGIFVGTINIYKAESLLLHSFIRCIIGLLVIGVFYLGIYLIVSRKTGALKKEKKNGTFCRHKIVIAEKGLTETTEVNNSHHSWDGIDKLEETEDYLIVHLTHAYSYLIPKRYFKNQSEAKAFVSDFNKYLQDAN